MDRMMGLVAYLGPETMLPMTSVIAGIIGVVLMVGRQTWSMLLGVLRIKGRGPRATARVKRSATANGPHMRIPAEGEASPDATDAAVAARSAGTTSTPIVD